MKFLLTGIITLSLTIANAQDTVLKKRDDCGTIAGLVPYTVPSINPNGVQATLPYLIKVFVFVCADDDGVSNIAATKADVMDKLLNMRNFFDDHSICFILGGYEQINSTDLNNHNTDTEPNDLNPYLVPGYLNIFVHNALGDNTGALNGMAYGIPNYFLSIVGTAISSTTNLTTLAHEVGHDFGLYHTFETFNNSAGMPTKPENVPRSGACSNCGDNGDLLCDTEADRDELVNASCTYSGTLLDACNNLFAPNTRNIMGYGNRACRNFFTVGQGNRARATIDATPSLSSTIAPDNVTVSNTNFSSGRQSLLARSTITINAPSYIVQGSTRMNMSAPIVRLQAGVRLSPGAGGYTAIRPNVLCQ